MFLPWYGFTYIFIFFNLNIKLITIKSQNLKLFNLRLSYKIKIILTTEKSLGNTAFIIIYRQITSVFTNN